MNSAIFVLALAMPQDPSDAIYDEGTFATYRITMAGADWNRIVNDPFGAGDLWQRCSVQWQTDAVVNDVAIKAVGTNRRSGNPKPSIRLKYDEFVPGREWRGVDTIKLEGNIIEGFNERLSYRVHRQYGVAAPRSSHALLYVNGDLKGVFAVIEPVRKKFIRYHLGIPNPTGNLYKISRENWPGDDFYLFRGWDPASYVPNAWEPITNEIGGDYRDVPALLDTLNNVSQAQIRTRLEGQIEMDAFLSYLAVLAVTGDLDSILWGDALNNHYWYHREDTNRMHIIPWDCSNTFGPSYWLDYNGKVNLEIYFGIDPAISASYNRNISLGASWMAGDSVARGRYEAKLRELIDGTFPDAFNHINSVNSQIRNAVLNDPYKNSGPWPVTNAEYDARVQEARDWVPDRIAGIRSQLPATTLPTVTITQTDPNAAEPSNTGTFTVTRTGPTASALSVVRDRSGTATTVTDFNALPSPIVIPAGQSSVTVTVTPIDDTEVEGSETVILTLMPNAAYTVGSPSSATVTIADNDSNPTLPSVTVTATDPNAAEPSNTGTFTVARTGPTTSALSVVRNRSGTATTVTDFNALPSPIVIPAGQSSVTVTVTPIDDTEVEGSETVTLTIASDGAYNVGTPSSATVTLADDDSATGTGLSVTYYDNSDLTGATVTRTDPTVDFNWGAGSPAPAIGPDSFSSRWTGRVRAQHSETYTFYTFTNDGARLWVEGELLVDQWVQQSGGIEWNAQLALQAGQWYTVQMDQYEGTGNAVARLSWSSPSTPKQVIPQSALDPALGAPDSRDNDGDGNPNDADLDDDNDGIPDLEDPDRDGDGASNSLEISAGTDPDDRASVPATAGGGGGGDGSGCGVTGMEALALLGLILLLRRNL